MRVVIAGGGTGGHLYPGLALAEELQTRDPGTEVVFIGTERGIEARIVPKEGYTIRFIPAEGFVGVSLLRKARSLFRLLQAMKVSLGYLRDIRPDIVVGSGGYASLAPLLCARLLSIPTMILEQNSVPGMTNRVLGHIVKSVCITYQESMAFFPREKVHLTGNPVRGKIRSGSRASGLRVFSLRDELFTVFVFGGSSGARAVNKAVVDALEHLLDLKDKIQFLHQTGEKDFEFVRAAYRSYGYSGTVTPYIYQMPEAYAVADVVVSRAGASTLSEICITGRPAIVIPFPHATARHQEVNARRLERYGAVVMIRSAELNGRRLAGEIRRLYGSLELRDGLRSKAISLGRPEAVRKVADIALSLASIKNTGIGVSDGLPTDHGWRKGMGKRGGPEVKRSV